MKDFKIVLAESVVVGIVLMIIVFFLNTVFYGILPMWPGVFLSGVIFHLAFEYSGLNKMYVDTYYTT